MSSATIKKIIPCKKKQLIEMVLDIEKYPEFVPWCIEGKVFVQFVVDKDGNLTNVQAIKGIGAGCDEEAVRVIAKAKRWSPGKQRGRPVKVRMILPITFKLG